MKERLTSPGKSFVNDNGFGKSLSVEELTKQNVDVILKLEEAAREQRTSTDRIAEAVATSAAA